MRELTAKGVIDVSKNNRSIMSEELKMEIAKELGVYDTVQKYGWGEVKAKDCGNIVRKAIEMAERSLKKPQQ